MENVTESTQLLHHERVVPHPFYYDRSKRVRKFQCCLCAIFITIFLIALVASVFYGINYPVINNSTNTSESNDFNNVLIILTQTFPKNDNNKKNLSLSTKDIADAMLSGKNAFEERENIEKDTPSLLINTPSYRHQRVTFTSENARNMSKFGYIQDHATKYIYSKYPKSASQQVCSNVSDSSDLHYCRKDNDFCNKYHKYRSYNGSCNNLLQPHLFGVAFIPFRRVLPPDYSDGVNMPRKSSNGKELPSARTVSLVVHRPYYRSDPKFTVMLAVWGQFLDHDITSTALSQKSNGNTISCCFTNIKLSPECFPVWLDNGDPFRQYNISCIEFVRSAAAPKCCLGPREQINQASAFIDGSVIYGTDEKTAKNLRTMVKGKLKMYITEDNRELLPVSNDSNDGCSREEQNQKEKYCFMTGDARANENLHLTSMHLLWARHHNKLVDQLTEINPHWDDEKLFQEARRIIGAQMQHITYNEFLPILLGPDIMQKFELEPKTSGYFTKYNSTMDPSIANNFASAAFRFAHTIIPGLMKLLSNDSSSPEYVSLHKMLFDPFKLYQPGELDRTIRGAMNTNIEASDSYFTNELKSHMFERPNKTDHKPHLPGLDLVSLNIQRGRDHGLPSYTKWRKYCNLKNVTSFDDLRPYINKDSLHNIQAIYRSVDDIDLYTGALSEKPLEESFLGPTITCLLLDQFIRIKIGDRFWYENQKHPQSFTEDQLQEIRKISLAGVICSTADDLNQSQPLVMERIREGNEYVPCEKMAMPNLEFWKDKFENVTMLDNNLLTIVH